LGGGLYPVNKVSVSIDIDEGGKATAKIKGLNTDLETFAAGAAKTAAQGAQGFAQVEREAQRLRESLNQNETALHNLARQYDQIAAKSKNAFNAGLAHEGARQAREQAARVSGFSNEFAFGDVPPQRFQQIKEGAGQAREVVGNLRVGVAALRDELGKEPEGASGGGHSKLFNITQAIIYRDLIRGVISEVKNFTVASIAASIAESEGNRALEASATRAGLSYTSIGQKVEGFARLVRTSTTEASHILADLIRLAERAGRQGDIDLIARRFADLAASRGLNASQLGSLTESLLGGGNESLNRLGIGSGKLDENFAKKIGVPTEALDQRQKAQAALNAVLEEGMSVEGEALKQSQSVAGQLDATRASYENLTLKVGDAVTNSIEFKDALDLVSGSLGNLVTSHDEARRELAKGLRTPEQIAQAERDSEGRQAFNFFKGTASAVFSGGFTNRDTLKLLFGQTSLADFQTNARGTLDAIFNPGQRQYEARVEQLRQLQKDIAEQEAKAAQYKPQPDNTAAQAAQEYKKAFDQAKLLDPSFEKLVKLQELQRKLPDLISGGAFKANEGESATQQTAAALKQIEESYKSLRLEARALIEELSFKASGDNQFIKILNESDKRIEYIRDHFKSFGSEFVEQMVRMQQAVTATDLTLARFDANQTALKYRQEARRLREPFLGLTGPEERGLDVLKAQTAAAVNIPKLNLEADRLLPSRQFETALKVYLDNRRTFDQQLRELQRLQSFAGGQYGRASNKVVDEQILALTGQLDQRILARSPDPIVRVARDARYGALKRSSTGYEEDIREAIERARAGERLQHDAREQLRLLQTSQLPQDEAVKRFLSITGQLSDKELTGDLRLGRARVLDVASQRESAKEQAAEATRKTLDGVLKKLDGLLTEKGLKIDGDGGSVAIQVSDRSDSASVSVLGPGYAPGFRE
jgi:hypothetical protein